jgi:hypothetical protein
MYVTRLCLAQHRATHTPRPARPRPGQNTRDAHIRGGSAKSYPPARRTPPAHAQHSTAHSSLTLEPLRRPTLEPLRRPTRPATVATPTRARSAQAEAARRTQPDPNASTARHTTPNTTQPNLTSTLTSTRPLLDRSMSSFDREQLLHERASDITKLFLLEAHKEALVRRPLHLVQQVRARRTRKASRRRAREHQRERTRAGCQKCGESAAGAREDPGGAWIRDLTEEGVEPHPGPGLVCQNIDGVSSISASQSASENFSSSSQSYDYIKKNRSSPPASKSTTSREPK